MISGFLKVFPPKKHLSQQELNLIKNLEKHKGVKNMNTERLKYFAECKSIEEIKKLYKTLCFKYHPDVSGHDTTEEMKKINAEFDYISEKMKHIHETAEGNTYKGKADEAPEKFRKIIETLVKCKGLTIEIIGSWIWLTGNTYANKTIIKDLGFSWSKSKKAWYWYSTENAYKSKYWYGATLDDIRTKYGSTEYSETQTVQRVLA